jgi:hypothetical protein
MVLEAQSLPEAKARASTRRRRRRRWFWLIQWAILSTAIMSAITIKWVRDDFPMLEHRRLVALEQELQQRKDQTEARIKAQQRRMEDGLPKSKVAELEMDFAKVDLAGSQAMLQVVKIARKEVQAPPDRPVAWLRRAVTRKVGTASSVRYDPLTTPALIPPVVLSGMLIFRIRHFRFLPASRSLSSNTVSE